MQESCCTLSAHRLHICPNQGLFCAWLAQPVFLCIKRRNFRRTRLSSILCVRLRPSAGWLQGSLCRRFLLSPAFRFAGAEVLPGSGLGNRSSLRSSWSVPAGACPACGRRCPCGWTFWFYGVIAGYPMQTVMRLSRCGTDLAIKNRHTTT